MKKVFLAVLSLMIVLSFAGCSKPSSNSPTQAAGNNSTQQEVTSKSTNNADPNTKQTVKAPETEVSNTAKDLNDTMNSLQDTIDSLGEGTDVNINGL